MTDVSPSRRRLGRWLLAGGALMLPLTASISYAAAQDRTVESVDVDPSAAPSAPVAPEAPEAPQAPDAPRIERHVQTFKIHREGERANRDEHRVIVMRDGPMSEAQRKHFEEMGREWDKKGAEWEKMAKEHQKMALAMAEQVPDVSTDCDKAGGSGSRSWTDDSGRQHVVICERIIRQQARMAEGQASMGLRRAREAIAHNDAISASVRDQVLAELDQEIVRLEAERQ